MEFGKSNLDSAIKAGGFDSGNIIKMKSFEFDIPYVFRILEPIVPVRRVMFPCIVPDQDNPGFFKQSWRSVRLPMNYSSLGWSKSPTVIDVLRDIDLAIRTENKPLGSTDKVKSFFDAQRLWVFPVLDRRDTKPVVKFLEAGKQILDGIKKLVDDKDEDDQSKMAMGPHWVHDIIITKRKKEDAKLKESFRTYYTVKARKDNLFEGKLDRVVLEPENCEILFKESVEGGIFTEEEFGIISLFSPEAELYPLYQPQTPEQILLQFNETPLALNGVNKDNNPIFMDKETFAQRLNEEALKGLYLEESKDTSGESFEPPPPDKKEESKPAESTSGPDKSEDSSTGKSASKKPSFITNLNKK